MSARPGVQRRMGRRVADVGEERLTGRREPPDVPNRMVGDSVGGVKIVGKLA